MEEKRINEETEEILENNASSIPEELEKYLEKDETTLGKIEEVLSDLDDRMEKLNQEKIDSEKSFDDRLAEFQEMIAKEKEDAFNEFSRREQEIDAEKSRIESIKLEEQGKQVNYIDTLKEISDSYGSKISSIEEAIKACGDNDSLTRALEEEKNKLENDLSKEYESRKVALDEVLSNIGFEKEEQPIIEEPKIDFNIEPSIDIYDDNEVINHEQREDVITDIYQSEEVMEGHLFPYLKSLRN